MKRPIICFFILVSMTWAANPVISLSASAKASKDYRMTLDVIRKLGTVTSNYPVFNEAKEYDKLKSLFKSASEDYYGRNYTESVKKFSTLKKELITFLDRVAIQYLERTKSILDSTSKESFDIIVDFGKESSFAKYFHKPYDPLKGVKPYSKKYGPEDYHFFRDKEVIERYLKEGYMTYHFSKKIYEDPEIAILKAKKKMTSQNMNYIIQRYLYVVKFCRQSKQYGIEIHKIRKINDTGKILRKYDLSGDKLTPIFDDRIPDNYKVDAIDNLNLLHSIELKKLEAYR